VTEKTRGGGVDTLPRTGLDQGAAPGHPPTYAARLQNQLTSSRQVTSATEASTEDKHGDEDDKLPERAGKNPGRVFDGFEVIHSTHGFPVSEEFKFAHVVRVAATPRCFVIKMTDCIIEARGSRAHIKKREIAHEKSTTIKVDPHPEYDHGRRDEMHVTFIHVWEAESVIRFTTDGSAFVPSGPDLAAALKQPANEE
jgi:hypothetical protein